MAASALTIDEYGRALGHVVWLERRCFELFGALARAEPDPAAKLAFAAASTHHGFHAALLEPLLPDTRDHDPESFVRPATDADADLTDPAALLARIDEALAESLAAMTPVAGAAAERLLGLVGADHESDARGPRDVR